MSAIISLKRLAAGLLIIFGRVACNVIAFTPTANVSRVKTTLTTLLRSTKLPMKELPSTRSRRDYGSFGDVRKELSKSTKGEKGKSTILQFDPDGHLRFGDQILLKGLEPSVWSATRPNERGKQSLFLHTSHPEARSEHESTLGNLEACSRLLACARQSRYWMGPKMAGRSCQDIPHDTQFLLLELENNEEVKRSSDKAPPTNYALVLPLLDRGFRASLRPSKTSTDGSTAKIQVICAACSGDATVQVDGSMRALYVAIGTDPFRLLRKGFEEVAQTTGTFQTLSNKRLPPSVNQFGWCTWDAFYSSVSDERVVKGVKSLREAGTPARFVILDDGWQQVSPLKTTADDGEIRSPNASPNATINWWQRVLQDFYKQHVLTADPEKVVFRIFRWFCHSILKPQLWNFFDTYTDFNRQLSGFAPNEKFESSEAGEEKKSLKSLVKELKQELGVKQVLCWHALHGYWRGVSEELGRKSGLDVKTVYPKPSASILRIEPNAAWDPVSLFGVGLMSNEKDLGTFYEKLHTPLVEAGIDGVKVDIQSGVSAAGDRMGTGGPKLAELYTRAMEESVGERFRAANGAVNSINCMCHSTENLYRYQVTAVARASDDFFPDRPESHTVHLINVAYNSLFLGEICLPDWDMFHSKHPSAGLHAAARAIGGCPVYVSDAPSQHDANLLRKLVLPDGSTLRASLPGRPTRDCLFVDVGGDGQSALKIWNQNVGGKAGVVGAFHVQGVNWNFRTHENEILHHSPSPVTAIVKPHDVETLRDNLGPFAVWRHNLSKMEYRPRGDSIMRATLNHQDWEIFTVVPLQVSSDNLMWGPVGLVNMLNSGGAIVESDDALDRATSSWGVTRARLVSRGPGRFVAFTNRRPLHVLVNGAGVDYFYEEGDCELSFELPNEVDGAEGHHILVEWSNTNADTPMNNFDDF